MDDFVIRKCRASDRDALHALCCDTTYFGEKCENFFSDRELLADLVMRYFTDHEPMHTWVAEKEGELAGYICACYEESRFSRVMLYKILPVSILKSLGRGRIFSLLTLRMVFYNLAVFIKRESVLKRINHNDFPVHIHQNIKEGFRGKGLGAKLLSALLKDARENRVKGIRFRALRQEPKFGFFEKHGFILSDCRRVRTMENWLGRRPLYYMEYLKRL